MRIALYHPWVKEKGGTEKTLLKAAQNSNHEVEIFTHYFDQESTWSEFGNEIEVHELESYEEVGGFVRKMIRFELKPLLTTIDNLDEFDAFVVSTSGVGTSIIFRNDKLPALAYSHTPLRTKIPNLDEFYRKELPIYLRPFYGLANFFFGKLEKYSYQKFDHIMTNSENTKNRILNRSLADEDNISVVHPGAEKKEGGDFENYFLYPSRFRRYKRQELAVKGFEEADLENFKLILAGSGQEEDYIDELREISDEQVEIKTDVEEDEWHKLHQNCYAGIFTALEEDWGIATLELMGYGKPVISVDEGGPTDQIIDGETGFLVKPTQEAIAEKMEELSDDLERVKEMGERAQERVEVFSWSNFQERFHSKIKDVVDRE